MYILEYLKRVWRESSVYFEQALSQYFKDFGYSFQQEDCCDQYTEHESRDAPQLAPSTGRKKKGGHS